MKASRSPSLSRLNLAIASLCLISLAGCAVAPQGPRVAIMPTPGKPLELFAQEDQYCRSYAQQSIGPDTSAERAVGAAVVGTILGAAVGSAMSGRHHNNTAAGAATGLIMGTAIGAGGSAAEGQSAQQRYDIAYQQCMVSKNNQPSQGYARPASRVVYVQQPAPQAPPAPYYPPPAPSYYPPPPPPQ
jgi:outer membrane lipoprotein SlyB